jgi:hypothetical protein
MRESPLAPGDVVLLGVLLLAGVTLAFVLTPGSSACLEARTWWHGPAAPDAASGPADVRRQVAVGDPLPDVALRDLEGREVRLRAVGGGRPVVIEFGSFT